jgi:putative N6-adenine-specific DNA methylase
MVSSPISKRVKRHVVGPVHTFFAATAPHLETLCFNELKSLSIPPDSIHMTTGGVDFKGRLQDCYAANLLLRTPNRILMRIAEFKATNFRQLEKKLSHIPWELFIHPFIKRSFTIKTRHSRLYHKAAIGESAEKCIALHMNHTLNGKSDTLPATGNQQVFLRAVEDRFTVSIDTSGELLFKRGLKQHTGKAPIRETLAAAILAYAGYTGKEPLVDPMCGTGTFSLEAAMQVKHIPPGWYREFTFMTWPAFKKRQWDYIKKASAGQMVGPEKKLVFASDRELSMCGNLEKIARQFELSDTIQVMHKDFFEWKPVDITRQKGLVVLNPPFGVRVGAGQIPAGYYDEILQKLKKDYQGWRIAILVPSKQYLKEVHKSLKIFPIYHGGLNLSLLVGKTASL